MDGRENVSRARQGKSTRVTGREMKAQSKESIIPNALE